MAASYVEQQEGAYRIAGTRVSLDSVVYAFLDGQTAEAIAQIRGVPFEKFHEQVNENTRRFFGIEAR